MRDPQTIGEARWPDTPEWVATRRSFQEAAVTRMLAYVWKAYDLLREELLDQIDCTQANRDLERSITQYLAPRINRVMPGHFPFDVLHEPYEFETAKKPPARPPQPDIAFVVRENQRVMWPLEAKTLRTDTAVAKYVREIRNNFLSCRYGPFSSGGAMLGYLVSGDPVIAFSCISDQIPCDLAFHPAFRDRDHRTSDHRRTVPPGKRYPREFRCHHLIFRLTNSESLCPEMSGGTQQ